MPEMCQYARQNNAEAVVQTDIKEQRNQTGSVFFCFFMGSENSGEVYIICIRGIDCPERRTVPEGGITCVIIGHMIMRKDKRYASCF